jgi:hypothetical protein
MSYRVFATAAAAALLFAGGNALAQTAAAPAPSTTAAPDPVRLAEARKTVDVIMPPATREALIGGMVDGLMGTMANGLLESPSVKAMLEEKPGAKAVFERFMARVKDASRKDLMDNLPGMFEAMAHAYARRFTVEQMHDISAFFGTPSGKAYMASAGTIMSDPDVVAWQKALMQRAMARMPGDQETLKREIDALD